MYFSHVLGKCYKTLVAEQIKFILIYLFININPVIKHFQLLTFEFKKKHLKQIF